MRKNKLKMYMGYFEPAGSEEEAVLIFANTVREARKTGYPQMITDGDYTDFTVMQLPEHQSYLYAEADQEKLLADVPHAVNPNTCSQCEMWGTGEQVDGVCERCRDDELEYLG